MKMCKSRSDGRSGKGGGWLCAEDKKAEEGERRIDPPTGFDHPCKNLSRLTISLCGVLLKDKPGAYGTVS